MKKTTKLSKILCFLLALCMTFTLMACNSASGTEGENANRTESAAKMTLVISGESKSVFEVELDKLEVKEGLVSVLEYLKTEGKLDYEISSGFLESVGELKNDYTAGKYIYIYTSVESDQDVSEYATTVEYEGKTLVSSGVGANKMKIVDGAVVYIGLISW